MGRAARAALAFLGGVVAGYVLSLALYIVITSVGGVVDRDGGLAMGFAFMVGPFVGFLCGVGAAIWMVRRAST